MCVYEGYNKARDCRQETLVIYEVHRYLNTNEWINAAEGAGVSELQPVAAGLKAAEQNFD